jgi:hypothetical protein
VDGGAAELLPAWRIKADFKQSMDTIAVTL